MCVLDGHGRETGRVAALAAKAYMIAELDRNYSASGALSGDAAIFAALRLLFSGAHAAIMEVERVRRGRAGGGCKSMQLPLRAPHPRNRHSKSFTATTAAR